MPLYCPECGSTDLRTSHLRMRDYVHLLAMQFPVRCRMCKARSYGALRLALQLPRPQHARMRDRKTL